jgi:hypothetical protein
VIGVVADVRHRSLDEPPQPRIYDLLGQHWGRTLLLVARAQAGAPPPMMSSIRSAVASIDREAPVFEPATWTI